MSMSLRLELDSLKDARNNLEQFLLTVNDLTLDQKISPLDKILINLKYQNISIFQ